jgi:DNA end-binding protein Ku
MTAMRSTDKVAICRVTLRTKTYLATLRILDDKVLAMSTLAWPDEIRQPNFAELDKAVTLTPQEVEVAKMLVESMSGTFKPEEFSDTYTMRMAELIEAKASGEVFTPAKPAELPTEDVDDLMAVLQASVAAKNAAKKHDAPPVKAPRKRTPKVA